MNHSHDTETRIGPGIGLAIAGFDPSSGAGVTADLKVFAAHGVYGMAAITALTVQSTQGVRRSETVRAALLTETLECLGDDVSFAGVKIGMLANEDNVRAVARWLRRKPPTIVVLDPVLNSSSGAALLDAGGIDALRQDLLGLVGWITPNWAELAALTGIDVSRRDDLPNAARRLREMAEAAGNPLLNVVATGGDQGGRSGSGEDVPDSSEDLSSDFLVTAIGEQFELTGRRVRTTSTHGTGCAFSTALLCELIKVGEARLDRFAACSRAKAYVARALEAAYPIGKGRGPLHLAV